MNKDIKRIELGLNMLGALVLFAFVSGIGAMIYNIYQHPVPFIRWFGLGMMAYLIIAGALIASGVVSENKRAKGQRDR